MYNWELEDKLAFFFFFLQEHISRVVSGLGELEEGRFGGIKDFRGRNDCSCKRYIPLKAKNASVQDQAGRDYR